MLTSVISKYLSFFLLFICGCIFSYRSFAQDTNTARLRNALAKAKSDTSRIQIMTDLADIYPRGSDSAFYFANNALILSRKVNSLSLEGYCLQQLGNVLLAKNDLTNALEITIEALHIAETINSERGKAMAEDQIGRICEQTGDWQSSLNYERKAYTGYKNLNSKWAMVSATIGMGYAYLGLNKLDSALFFENQAYEEIIGDTALRNDNNLLSDVNSDIGEINIKLKNYSIALDYIRTSIAEDKSNDAWGYYDVATIFKETGKTDSAIYYSKQSLAGGRSENSQMIIIISTGLLSQLYQPLNRDSAYTYLLLNKETNDSLFSQEKIQKAQSITFQQQLHEQEDEARKQQLVNERNENIQFALIALGIITLLIFYLLLSRSFITNTKLIKFFGVIALLIVFEFLNLLLHPFLENITHHSPVLMLLALVCIAALLVPLHHKTEKWATAKLVEKNKQIRLAAARKTIQQLDTKPDDKLS